MNTQILRVISAKTQSKSAGLIESGDLFVRLLRPHIWKAVTQTSPYSLDDQDYAKEVRVSLWIRYVNPEKQQAKINRATEVGHRWESPTEITDFLQSAAGQKLTISNSQKNLTFLEKWQESADKALSDCRDCAIPDLLKAITKVKRYKAACTSGELILYFQKGVKIGVKVITDEGGYIEF